MSTSEAIREALCLFAALAGVAGWYAERIARLDAKQRRDDERIVQHAVRLENVWLKRQLAARDEGPFRTAAGVAPPRPPATPAPGSGRIVERSAAERPVPGAGMKGIG